MARVPHLVPRRVIAKWETLVGGAIQAEEERTLHESHWNEYSSTPFVPHLVPRRVIAKWETLVGRAIEAEEERTLHKSHWNEYSSTPFVPEIVHQQEENIDNILQTAHSVQDQYPQYMSILMIYHELWIHGVNPGEYCSSKRLCYRFLSKDVAWKQIVVKMYILLKGFTKT